MSLLWLSMLRHLTKSVNSVDTCSTLFSHGLSRKEWEISRCELRERKADSFGRQPRERENETISLLLYSQDQSLSLLTQSWEREFDGRMKHVIPYSETESECLKAERDFEKRERRLFGKREKEEACLWPEVSSCLKVFAMVRGKRPVSLASSLSHLAFFFLSFFLPLGNGKRKDGWMDASVGSGLCVFMVCYPGSPGREKRVRNQQRKRTNRSKRKKRKRWFAIVDFAKFCHSYFCWKREGRKEVTNCDRKGRETLKFISSCLPNRVISRIIPSHLIKSRLEMERENEYFEWIFVLEIVTTPEAT